MSKALKTKPRNLGEAIASVVTKAAGKWTKTKKSEERRPAYVSYRRTRMTAARGLSQKDAMADAAEAAYLAASANGALPATARQVMYAARPAIEALTGRRLDDQYFCQTLLPDYIEENGLDWDVVFDARGHFTEPQNGGKIVNLGTLDVRSYLAKVRDAKLRQAKLKSARVSTRGPDCSFGAVLFIEKEGFQPLFDRIELARKHDIAIMSTKGVSVTAARLLVDRMCSDHDIPLMVMHDFDVAGFTILDTLRRDTRRYQFEGDFKVIDLGLRLQDVQAMGLQPEGAARTKSSPAKIRARLSRAGATPEECEFLAHQRVELNAMTSEQLIGFIERKLAEHGVQKIIPTKETLDDTYRLFEHGHRLEEAFEKLKKEIVITDAPVPDDLDVQIIEIMKKRPTLRWDEVVKKLFGDTADEAGDDGDDGGSDGKAAKKLAGEFEERVRKVLGDDFENLWPAVVGDEEDEEP